jgi:hypothetical protein
MRHFVRSLILAALLVPAFSSTQVALAVGQACPSGRLGFCSRTCAPCVTNQNCPNYNGFTQFCDCSGLCP